jgi:hypothetical protein
MAMVSGKVQYINERSFNGKMLYSIKLAPPNGEVLYMMGTAKPDVSKGDYVSFDGEDKGNNRFQVDTKTFQVKKAEVLHPSSGGARDTYWDKKAQDDKSRQATIEYQAARNSAISAVGVILNAGAFKLPAKDSDKYAVVIGLINDLTAKFFAETKTLGTVTQQEKASPETEEVKESEEEWS